MITSEKLRLLNGYLYSLQGQSEVLAKVPERPLPKPGVFDNVEREIQQIERDFPGLIPDLGIDRIRKTYDIFALRSAVYTAVGKLKSACENEAAVPIEARDFGFVKDVRLKGIIERDYRDIQLNRATGAWKPVIILSGSTIEAILLDLLKANLAKALAAQSAPPKKKDVDDWDLSELISVSTEVGLVDPGLSKFSGSVRQYRNLVHPGRELAGQLKCNREEAEIAANVLDLLHRHLSSKKNQQP